MAMPYIYAQFEIIRTILTCLTLELRNLNLYIESSTCKNLSFNKKKHYFASLLSQIFRKLMNSIIMIDYINNTNKNCFQNTETQKSIQNKNKYKLSNIVLLISCRK